MWVLLPCITMACKRTTKQLVECSSSGLSTQASTPTEFVHERSLWKIASYTAPNLKAIALTKTMYTEICNNEDQAFDDVTEESGKKKFSTLSLRNCSGLFRVKALLNRSKKKWQMKTPAMDSEVTKHNAALIKDN